MGASWLNGNMLCYCVGETWFSVRWWFRLSCVEWRRVIDATGALGSDAGEDKARTDSGFRALQRSAQRRGKRVDGSIA